MVCKSIGINAYLMSLSVLNFGIVCVFLCLTMIYKHLYTHSLVFLFLSVLSSLLLIVIIDLKT